MAIVHFVNYKRGTQSRAAMRGVMLYVMQEKKTAWEGKPLVSGINCQPQSAYDDFLNTKLLYEFYRDQGAIMANDPSDFIGTNGCYYYKGQDSVGRKQMNLEGNHLVLAPHEGIIPSDLWLKCRAKCLEAQQIKPYRSEERR